MSHILVIDDQPHIGELLSEDLAGEGHSVDCLGDANYVMAYLKEESRPDLILLDLYLQGFEGWNLLHRIKSYDESLPVLIVSAYDSFVSDPRLAEADGYVVKSFDTNELKDKIHEKLAAS